MVAAGLVACAVATTVAARPIDDGSALSPDVAIFFYPWYGTPTRDGAFQHWSQHDTQPPLSIASSFFPARGIYSSSDPGVLRAQMAEIAGAGIGVVIVSWWGAGSVEDQRLPEVIATAR